MQRSEPIEPILAELISHCERPPEAAWSSRTNGGREWQVFACWDDRLQKCHIYRARPDDPGSEYVATEIAWDACERELRRLAIPFDRWTTDFPRREHISFQVPG